MTITKVAVRGATELGLDVAIIPRVVMTLHPDDFYKSMTSYADSTTWQDVYRPHVRGAVVYVKVTVIATERLVVLSFKRK